MYDRIDRGQTLRFFAFAKDEPARGEGIKRAVPGKNSVCDFFSCEFAFVENREMKLGI